MYVPARVVSVRKFSHRLIDLMSHRQLSAAYQRQAVFK